MTFEHLTQWLIYAAAAPATIYLLWFALGRLSRGWWRTLLGRAVFVHGLSIALLLDLSILGQLLGPRWAGWSGAKPVTVAVLALICLGECLMLVAYAVEWVRERRERHAAKDVPR